MQVQKMATIFDFILKFLFLADRPRCMFHIVVITLINRIFFVRMFANQEM